MATVALEAMAVKYHFNRHEPAKRKKSFYEYYQIIVGDADHDTESESDESGELKADGLHSPWGLEYNIIEKTGWTRHYMLWKVSWLNIGMMLADAPKMVKVPKTPTPKKLSTEAELLEFFANEWR
jgi:hypothetical protein